MRARSWTMRDGFADVLRGLQLREEVDDYAKNGTAPGLRRTQGIAVHAERPRRHTTAPPPHPTEVAVMRASNQPPTDTLPSSPGSARGEPAPDAAAPEANGTFIDAVGQSGLRTDATTTASIESQPSGLRPDAAWVLEIDPGWGSRKIFQHYRATLSAIAKNTTGADERCAVGAFRQVNAAIEARLRAQIPARMKQIDDIYPSAPPTP